MARLQRLWQQRVPHPILIFAAAKKNGPPAAWSWDADRDRMPEGGIILGKKPPEWHLPLPQPSSRYDEPRPIPIFVAAEKNGPPAVVVAATSSASDSNLRCGKEEWPACSMVVGRRQGQDATKAA